MKRLQLIHQLNNTELGKTGMADNYLNVTKDLSLKGVIAEKTPFKMTCAKNGKSYGNFRYEVAAEQRIYGFGKFFREEGLNAGDLVIIDFFATGFVLNAIKYDNLVILLKQGNNGLIQVLNPDRMKSFGLDKPFRLMYNGCYGTADLSFVERKKKRANARIATDFYSLGFNGVNLDSKLQGDRYYKLYKTPGFFLFSQTNKDKLITITY